MFVIELTFQAPLAEVDAHMKEHMVFLRKYYASGNFLVSGRQIPRTGGIIVAVAESKERVETIMREDPFVSHGVATVRVIEFRASQKADDIQQRIDAQ
jgi:uncharacterized protein YciI